MSPLLHLLVCAMLGIAAAQETAANFEGTSNSDSQQDSSLIEGEMSGYDLNPETLYAGELSEVSADAGAAEQSSESIYAGEMAGYSSQPFDSSGQADYVQGMAADEMIYQARYPGDMEGDMPTWLADARSTGYYGPNGYVPPAGGSSSGGSNKGAVIGLSVAGAIVGLVSLFTAGFILRRRMQHRTDRSGEAIGSKSSGRAISKSHSASYKRLREMEARDETEMSPLAGRLDEDSDDQMGSKAKSKTKVTPS